MVIYSCNSSIWKVNETGLGNQGQPGISKNQSRIKKNSILKNLHHDMIVNISDPKKSNREALNLINSFSAVAGYKINSNQWTFSTQRINRLRKKLVK